MYLLLALFLTFCFNFYSPRKGAYFFNTSRRESSYPRPHLIFYIKGVRHLDTPLIFVNQEAICFKQWWVHFLYFFPPTCTQYIPPNYFDELRVLHCNFSLIPSTDSTYSCTSIILFCICAMYSSINCCLLSSDIPGS